MDDETGFVRALYAIADTHLGLRQGAWRDPLVRRNIVDRRSDEPEKVADFLRWMEDIPPTGCDINVLTEGRVEPRILQGASHLVLLGDVLELWDAENEAVLLSSTPVGQVLSELRAEKIYVLGNHDSVLEFLQGSYPYGLPGLTLVRNSFPPPDKNGRVPPIRIGGQEFVFVHGHQLDLAFRVAFKFRLLNVLGRLRQFGAATGPYALFVFGLLFLISLPLVFATPSVSGWVLLASLFLLAFPRLYMRVARPLYDLLVAGKKYNRSRALRGFYGWWKNFRSILIPADNLGVVFGHTHYLDWIEFPEQKESLASVGRKGRKLARLFGDEGLKRRSLYNISAWVKVSGRHSDVVRAAIFYADSRGPLLLGWDWNQKRPFHIPFPFVAKKRDPRVEEALTSEEVEIAKQLGWPDRLIERWQRERVKT